MLTKSRYPCKYQELGCNVTNWAIDFGGHERSCKYKPYTVPKVFGDCHWTGSVHHLIQHLTYHHKVVTLNGNHFVQSWLMEQMSDHNNNIWPNVVHYDNHYLISGFHIQILRCIHWPTERCNEIQIQV